MWCSHELLHPIHHIQSRQLWHRTHQIVRDGHLQGVTGELDVAIPAGICVNKNKGKYKACSQFITCLKNKLFYPMSLEVYRWCKMSTQCFHVVPVKMMWTCMNLRFKADILKKMLNKATSKYQARTKPYVSHVEIEIHGVSSWVPGLLSMLLVPSKTCTTAWRGCRSQAWSVSENFGFLHQPWSHQISNLVYQSQGPFDQFDQFDHAWSVCVQQWQ